MAIVAGRLVDAADLSGLPHDGTVDTAPGTIAANFTLTESKVRTALNGKLVFLSLTVTSTNAITATGGNIADTTIFTLDAAYRPSESVGFAWGGNVTGYGSLGTNGVMQIWTASDNIAAGNIIRMSAMWLRA